MAFRIDRRFQQIEKLATCRHDIRFTTGNNVSHAREIPEDAVSPWGYSTRLIAECANVSDQEVWLKLIDTRNLSMSRRKSRRIFQNHRGFCMYLRGTAVRYGTLGDSGRSSYFSCDSLTDFACR